MSKRRPDRRRRGPRRCSRRRLRLERQLEQRHDADERVGRRVLLRDHDVDVVADVDHRHDQAGRPLEGLALERDRRRRRRPRTPSPPASRISASPTPTRGSRPRTRSTSSRRTSTTTCRRSRTPSRTRAALAGLLGAVSTISTTLKTAGQQVSSTIDGFQSLDAKGELETAFKAAPSCKDLTD